MPFKFLHPFPYIFQLISSLREVKNQFYISYLFAGNFCVKTEISVTYFGVFAAFPASFCLLFFAGQRQI
jgi:hypothetical protein